MQFQLFENLLLKCKNINKVILTDPHFSILFTKLEVTEHEVTEFVEVSKCHFSNL